MARNRQQRGFCKTFCDTTGATLTSAGPSFVLFDGYRSTQGGAFRQNTQQHYTGRPGLWRVEAQVRVMPRSGQTIIGNCYMGIRVGTVEKFAGAAVQMPGQAAVMRAGGDLVLAAGQLIEVVAAITGGDGNGNPAVGNGEESTFLTLTELSGDAR